MLNYIYKVNATSFVAIYITLNVVINMDFQI